MAEFIHKPLTLEHPGFQKNFSQREWLNVGQLQNLEWVEWKGLNGMPRSLGQPPCGSESSFLLSLPLVASGLLHPNLAMVVAAWLAFLVGILTDLVSESTAGRTASCGRL